MSEILRQMHGAHCQASRREPTSSRMKSGAIATLGGPHCPLISQGNRSGPRSVEMRPKDLKSRAHGCSPAMGSFFEPVEHKRR